ncbi:MAG: hypothetical protein ACR2M3_06365 [Thermomicrobiales bacterium]
MQPRQFGLPCGEGLEVCGGVRVIRREKEQEAVPPPAQSRRVVRLPIAIRQDERRHNGNWRIGHSHP